MKRNLAALALFGALVMLPQALNDASASSKAAATSKCSTSCPLCPHACESACPVADGGSK
jgi:anaerobic selenocysteine-containing dehydrogenase